MNKAILFAAALSMTPLPAMSQQAQQSQDQSQDRQSTYSERDRDSRRGDLLDRLSRSDLRDRLSTAIQRLEGACGEDIEQFCSDVTPGGGRMASCMDAYSDQLSRSCSFALSRAADRIQQAVEYFADTCMSAVQQQCGNADNMRQCLQQKNASLPHSCQTIIAAVQQGRQALAARLQGQGEQAQAQTGQEQGGPQQSAQAQGDQGVGRLRGLPAFSSDGKDLGQVVKVERAPDGKIQSVQIQVGRLLGLGEKTVTIEGNKIEQLADRVRVMMNSDQIRTLPDTKGQGGGAQR
jgi:cysteine rich repeat protein/PRC-barrel domain protein